MKNTFPDEMILLLTVAAQTKRYTFEGCYQARQESWWGSGQNRNLAAPFTKIIMVDVALDNNAFIVFFTHSLYRRA